MNNQIKLKFSVFLQGIKQIPVNSIVTARLSWSILGTNANSYSILGTVWIGTNEDPDTL